MGRTRSNVGRKAAESVRGLRAQNKREDREFAQTEAGRVSPWVSDKQVNESGYWWWWNGDLDSAPVPVYVMWSGSTDTYFASMGQLGWNRAQDIIGMGGFWLRLPEPPIPKTI